MTVTSTCSVDVVGLIKILILIGIVNVIVIVEHLTLSSNYSTNIVVCYVKSQV